MIYVALRLTDSVRVVRIALPNLGVFSFFMVIEVYGNS